VDKIKMKLDEFNTVVNELTASEQAKCINEDTNQIEDAEPKSLTLDSIVYVSQALKSGEVKKFEFVICEVWLKPQNIWTVVNIKKEREEENFWILFFDNGNYYLKKGIKGPIGVHVQLKHKKED
jgi:hypothetical protein